MWRYINMSLRLRLRACSPTTHADVRLPCPMLLCTVHVFVHMEYIGIHYSSGSQAFETHEPIGKCCISSRTAKAVESHGVLGHKKISIYLAKFPNDLL